MTARRRNALGLLAVLLVSAALRLPGLGDESLWFDEFVTKRAVSRSSFAAAIASTRQRDTSTPPLHVLTLRA